MQTPTRTHLDSQTAEPKASTMVHIGQHCQIQTLRSPTISHLHLVGLSVDQTPSPIKKPVKE